MIGIIELNSLYAINFTARFYNFSVDMKTLINVEKIESIDVVVNDKLTLSIFYRKYANLLNIKFIFFRDFQIYSLIVMDLRSDIKKYPIFF